MALGPDKANGVEEIGASENAVTMFLFLGCSK